MAVSNTEVFKLAFLKKKHLNKLNSERKRLIFDRNCKNMFFFLNWDTLWNSKLYIRLTLYLSIRQWKRYLGKGSFLSIFCSVSAALIHKKATIFIENYLNLLRQSFLDPFRNDRAEIVSVISSYPPCKADNSRFTTVPLKLLSD